MRNRSKLLLAALGATVVLGAALSTASANRFALSNQFFRATWTELNFGEFATGVNLIHCHVTIEGSFHSRTLSKVTEALVGYVTKAIVARPCVGGEAWTLTAAEGRPETLPWHIRYAGFTGTLPGITSVKLTVIGGAFLVTYELGFGLNSCLYVSEVANPMTGTVNMNGGVAESLSAGGGIPVHATLEGSCTKGKISGTSATLTLLGATTKITVTLVA